jgi:hypothetical protein
VTTVPQPRLVRAVDAAEEHDPVRGGIVGDADT